MKKRTTKVYNYQQPIRLANKGQYHSTRRDEYTLADLPQSEPQKNELVFSEIECFQYVDTNDFYKKQHINQLIYIKNQQKIIDNLKNENQKLQSLNQDLLYNIDQLNDEGDQKDTEIKHLNSKIRQIKKLIK